jgi:hypothetical protein
MAEVRFTPRIDGFREIRYSTETQDMLEAVALTVADVANGSLKLNGPRDVSPGYKVLSRPGKRVRQGRWRVSVTAVTRHAIRHNAVHNTLVRALGGAR